MNLKFDLNPKQREAALVDSGPVLVIAGAGSGKTRVITYRIANLIKNGTHPSQILTMTFTNKAANEMAERASKLLEGEDISDLWIGTFHSICLKILRQHLDLIGYKPNYVIYDQEDSLSIVKEIVSKMNLDKDIFDPDNVYRRIQDAKMELVTYKNYYSNLPRNKQTSYYQTVADIYAEYQERLKYNNAFDFSDLIMKTIQLFRRNPEVLEKYQKQFKYVQADEYQDTNHSQYLILKMLADNNKNLFVVGDSDQSIYRFRGADIQNINNYEQDYANAKIIKLEQNYRSTSNIINASNAVVAHNVNRREKVAFTEQKPGAPVIICEADESDGEADFVGRTIQSLVRNNQADYKDIAILYRSNYQSRAFESRFMQLNIPYVVVNGVGFFNRKEIRDLIAILRLATNLQDTTSLVRLVGLRSSGIGPVTIGALQTHSYENNIPLIDVISSPSIVKGIGKVKAKAIIQFKERMIDPIVNIAGDETQTLQDKIFNIYKEIDYDGILLEDEETYDRRSENVEEFFVFVNNYYNKHKDATITQFLQDVKLMSDQDDIDEDDNRVKLMTVHASKGLEFKAVFVVGVEEETFPHYRSIETGLEEDIEEERRLCYVAMTRAEKRLFLSYSKARYQFGRMVDKYPSRFIDEIPSFYSKNIRLESNYSSRVG